MSTQQLFCKAVRRASSTLHKQADSFGVYSALAKAGARAATHVPTYTSPAELTILYDLAADCPAGANALEIGSFLGASTCYIAAGLKEKGGRLWCIDTWRNETMPYGSRDTYDEFRRNTEGVHEIITAVRKRSEDVVPGDIPAVLDLVFIDGDHSYEAARHDFRLVEPLMSPSGTIAFHDSRWFEGVSRTIGEALAGGAWAIAGNVNNLLWLKRPEWTEAPAEGEV